MVPACEVVTLVCNYHETCLPPLVFRQYGVWCIITGWRGGSDGGAKETDRGVGCKCAA